MLHDFPPIQNTALTKSYHLKVTRGLYKVRDTTLMFYTFRNKVRFTSSQRTLYSRLSFTRLLLLSHTTHGPDFLRLIRHPGVPPLTGPDSHRSPRRTLRLRGPYSSTSRPYFLFPARTVHWSVVFPSPSGSYHTRL